MAHADNAQEPPRRHGALTLLRDQAGHVLLVQPSYTDRGWQLPGGGAHRGEAPHLAQLRELAEETGLAPRRAGALLLNDYTPPGRREEGLNLVFDGGTVPPGTTVSLPPARPGEDEPELIAALFVAPARLRDYCNEHQTRRILAALAVLEDPTAPRYLVAGEVPDSYAEAS